MSDAGATQYTFHLEAADDVPQLCRKIKENGMKVSMLHNTTSPTQVFMFVKNRAIFL